MLVVRTRSRQTWIALALLAVIVAVAVGEAPDLGDVPEVGDRLPRIAPVAPEDALKSFSTAEGYELQLVAAEPLVASPVAMDFDAAGRLYVVEMRDYSEQAVEKLGRVRRLEDHDGDGRYEHATTFAEGLSWPTGVVCYDGGAFVAAAPDIWYLKDTSGDGVADVKRRVITGFGRGNVQGLVNSLRWTLDGRIHGATSSAGGDLQVVRDGEDSAAPPQKPLPARGRDFSFDPRTLDLRLESGGGQHGMCFDNWGRKFVCANSNHIQQVIFEDRYAARNSLLAAPSPLADIAVEGPAAEVFRRSPVEPWRVVRTELRVAGKVPGPIEGGGRAAGYFTSATGVTIYRGDAWPQQDRGVAIVGDVGSNLIHRKRLTQAGSAMRARRIDEQSEFVASTDLWFRPVQFANAPDGCLYVADMCREVIEHPASIPPVIKKHLDLTSGRDRGRIYRIAPAGFRPKPPPRLDQLTTQELVAALAHENGWHRDTAARLLIEKNDDAAAEYLSTLAAVGKSPLARMHGLYVLAALGHLEKDHIAAALDDEHPRVREHAVRLAAQLKHPPVEELLKLENDEDLLVRRQLAFTLGDVIKREAVDRPAIVTSLAALAQDSETRFAALTSISGHTCELTAAFVRGIVSKPVPADFRSLIEELASMAGREGTAAQLKALIADIEFTSERDPELASLVSVALLQGFVRSGRAPGDLFPKEGVIGKLIRERVAAAIASVSEENAAPASRAAALEVLSLAELSQVKEVLAELLAPQSPPELQLAAVRAIARRIEPGAAALVIDAWRGLGPAMRKEAVEALLGREDRTLLALAAIREGHLAGITLDPTRIAALSSHRNQKIRALAKEVFPAGRATSNQDRAKVVQQYQTALAAKGDAQRGMAAFRKHCSACHKQGDAGHAVGPDLATIRNRGAEAILLAMLDPNREVNPQYLNYTLRTTDGRTLTGIIASETATSVTLRRGEGATDVVLRAEIDELTSSGASLMPEGIEKEISPQDAADIIAHLLSGA